MDIPQWIQFGPHRFDQKSGELYFSEERRPLPPEDSAVLLQLVSRPNKLVSKQELLAEVWKDVVVGDAVVKTCIKRLRKVLGDDSNNPIYIETVHRRGYRFIGFQAPAFRELPSKGAGLIVGRERELARLQETFQHASDGQCRFVFISGEAGAGKSAFTNLFFETIRTRPRVLIGCGHCVDTQGPGEAFGPLFEVLESLAAQLGYGTIRDKMLRLAPMWLVQLPWLMEPGESEKLACHFRGAPAGRMLRELLILFKVLGQEHTIVLLLEDLHWSDVATLDALMMFLSGLNGAKILVILTSKPVAVSGSPLLKLHGKMSQLEHCSEITIQPLTEEEIDLYLNARFPGIVRPATLANWLVRCTEGNPLFIKALLTHAVEQGRFKAGGQLRWDKSMDANNSCGLPNSLREVIQEQFAAFPVITRRHLEQASVVGMRFSSRILCENPEKDEAALGDLLHEIAKSSNFIVQDGLVTWPDSMQSLRYGFIHTWYRQIIYENTPLVRKQKLHRLIGERLERIYGDLCSRIAPVLAQHFEMGRDIVKSVTYRRVAGELFLTQNAHQEAAEHLMRGLELLDRLPVKAPRVQLENDLRGMLSSCVNR